MAGARRVRAADCQPARAAFKKRGPVRATPTCRLAAHDLAAELRELQRLWLTEAIRHDVLPFDDRRVERFNPDLAGRPPLAQGTSQLLWAAWVA